MPEGNCYSLGGAPASPLSRLVHAGYDGHVAAAPPQRAALPPRAPGGFDAGVAQQWAGSVQQATASHQQQHDPTYAKRPARPSGYRVTQAPGGGSSLSLAWDGAGADAAPARRRSPACGAACGAAFGAACGGGLRAASPRCAAGVSRGAGAGRSSSPFALSGAAVACQQQAPSYGAACSGGARAASPGRPPPSYGATGGGAPWGGASSYAPPCYEQPLAYGAAAYNGSYGGGGGQGQAAARQAEATGLVFGARHGGQDGRSSNSYASGVSQNCGNFLCDRRTTRVAAPPGGVSSISFG